MNELVFNKCFNVFLVVLLHFNLYYLSVFLGKIQLTKKNKIETTTLNRR